MKLTDKLLVAFVLIAIVSILYFGEQWLHPHEFQHASTQAMQGVVVLLQIVGAIIGVLLLIAVVLGVWYVVVRINNERGVVRSSEKSQAVALRKNPKWQEEIIQFSPSVLNRDPAQQLAETERAVKLVMTMMRGMKQFDQFSPEEEEYIESDEMLALPAPQNIPDVIPYASIESQVPPDQSLLGIYPDNGDLEIVSPENYKTTWFVGGSNLGKTNTVYGKVADMVRWGARIIISDNHAHKPDSLTNKLSDFHHRLLTPVAQTPEEIKNATLKFLLEFLQRKAGLSSCDEMWLIVTDEVNATANLPVKLTEEEKAWLWETFAIKVDGYVVKLRVFLQMLAEACGYEARGFNMYGFFISQRVAHLSWLRNAMMTVFVHGLLMDSEALLAANNNRALAEQVKAFKKGRTLVYGYEFEQPLILQQPLYETTKPDSSNGEDFHSAQTVQLTAEDEFFARFNGEGRRAITGSLVNNVEPLDRRLPSLPNGTAQPALTSTPDEIPTVSAGEKFRFSDTEKPIVVRLYNKFHDIDEVLSALGRGSRWHKHASEILKEAGLL